MSHPNFNNVVIRSGLCKTSTKPREVCYSERGRKIFSFKKELNHAMAQNCPERNSTQQRIADAVKDASKKHGVSEKLILAVIKHESNFQPDAVSYCNAQGLMQLMPGTAKEMGVKDSFNIEQNIEGGTKYLSRMLRLFGGNKKLALAAYNAGPGAVMKYNDIPPYKETQNYVRRIMASLDRGDVRIPMPNAKPKPAPVRDPDAPVLAAKYQNVGEISGPRQIKFHKNTEIGATLAASNKAISDSIATGMVDVNSKIDGKKDASQGDPQEKRPLPPHAILA